MVVEVCEGEEPAGQTYTEKDADFRADNKLATPCTDKPQRISTREGSSSLTRLHESPTSHTTAAPRPENLKSIPGARTHLHRPG
jgi:hypothetical protein